MNMQKQTGFTIVELLIVIVVIAILASITVVAFNGIQERARTQQANSELAILNRAIRAARVNTDKTLILITGSNCTRCFDQARYEQTLDLLEVASGVKLSDLKDGDPWGLKYGIDENEGEGASPCASRDSLYLMTAGKTGVNPQAIPFHSCPN